MRHGGRNNELSDRDISVATNRNKRITDENPIRHHNALCSVNLNGDCLNRNAGLQLCVMPQGDKSQGQPREMTLKIRHGNGAAIVV